MNGVYRMIDMQTFEKKKSENDECYYQCKIDNNTPYGKSWVLCKVIPNENKPIVYYLKPIQNNNDINELELLEINEIEWKCVSGLEPLPQITMIEIKVLGTGKV